MTKNYILYATFGLLIMAACKKNEMVTYHSGEAIYFNLAGRDTAVIYFGFTTQDSTLRVPIKLLGKPAPTDRPYNILLDPDSSTLAAPEDFSIDGRQIIAANTYSDTLYIHFKHPGFTGGELQTDRFLYVRLENNSFFSTILRNTSSQASSNWNPYLLRIRTTFRLPKPSFWDRNEARLGNFSERKLKLMYEVMGLNYFRILVIGAIGYNDAQVKDIAKGFANYLKTEAANGNTVLDEDGKPMTMGPSATF